MNEDHGMGLGHNDCLDLRFRVHPFCRQRGGGLLQKTPEDREALRKCKEANPKKSPPKKGKKYRQNSSNKEQRRKKKAKKLGKNRYRRRKNQRKN